MDIPTISERKDFWLKAYALTSFQKSLSCTQTLIRNVNVTSDELFLPLAVAVHVFYGRPFKFQGGVGSLPKTYVPDEWLGIHHFLLTFRDKIMAHADSSNIEQAGRPLHDVVLHKVKGRKWFSTSDPRPDIDNYRRVADYLPLIIRKASEEIEAIHANFSDRLPPEDGDFHLNLTGDVLFSPFVPPVRTITF